jgi:hypothetical protein
MARAIRATILAVIVGDLGYAVEAPTPMRPCIARKHRPLTFIAGLVLFVCMFLPASKGCGEPVVPVDMPLPIWTPYIYGLAFAIVACARTAVGIAGATIVLRVLAWMVTVSGVAMLGVAVAIGVVEIVIGLVLLATIGWRRTSEARLAVTGIVMAAINVTWFAWWTLTPVALVGMWLSLVSSLAMFAGALMWLVEIAFAPVELPRATVVKS